MTDQDRTRRDNDPMRPDAPIDAARPPAGAETPPASAPPGPPPASAAGDPSPPRDAVGAYLLDALREEERRAFEAQLPSSPETQQDIRELAPVVRLLGRTLALTTIPAAAPAPTAALRERILTAARQSPETRNVGAAPVAPPPPVRPPTVERTAGPHDPRPLGRVRPGAPAAESEEPISIHRVRKLPPAWLAAASFAVLAVGATIWALALLGRVNDQRDELTDLRRQANATAAMIGPTADGPAAAQGALLYSVPNQAAVVLVRGLAPLPADRIYQLWYVDLEGGMTAEPGPLFSVDQQGVGVAVVSNDAPSYDAIALTQEPAAGSQQPTTAILMLGELEQSVG